MRHPVTAIAWHSCYCLFSLILVLKLEKPDNWLMGHRWAVLMKTAWDSSSNSSEEHEYKAPCSLSRPPVTLVADGSSHHRYVVKGGFFLESLVMFTSKNAVSHFWTSKFWFSCVKLGVFLSSEVEVHLSGILATFGDVPLHQTYACEWSYLSFSCKPP